MRLLKCTKTLCAAEKVELGFESDLLSELFCFSRKILIERFQLL